MKTDIYTKFILTVIAFGLLLIGMDTFVSTSEAEYKSPTYQMSAECWARGNKNYDSRCHIYVLDEGRREIRRWIWTRDSNKQGPRLVERWSIN